MRAGWCKRGARIALTSCLVVLAGLLIVAAAGPLTGAYRLVTVLSGSMGPGMPVGSMAVLRPADPGAVEVGDVITFPAPLMSPGVAGRPTVTHRVVEVVAGSAHPSVRTQGDANEAADPWTLTLDGDTVWRRAAVIPHAGSAVRALRSVPIRGTGLSVGSAVLLAVMLAFIWRPGTALTRTVPGNGHG